jgi:hypothetical protein
MVVSQVYGGGLSFVIHPYIWSANSFYGLSTASAGNTIVSGLLAIFNKSLFSNSRAETRSSGELTLRSSCFLALYSVYRLDALINSRLQMIAKPEMQRQALM